MLELALQQEQVADARAILSRAARREISLAIPAMAITEPFSTITQRLRSMQHLGNLVGERARDFSRSSLYVDEARDLSTAQAHLNRLVQQKHLVLEPIIADILAVSRVISVDSASFTQAQQLHRDLPMPLEDAMVLAAVLADLRRNPTIHPSLFVNKNTRDFGVVEVIGLLRRNNCNFSGDFNEANRRLSIR